MSDDEMLPKHKRERGGGERRRARESERKAVKRRDRNKGLKEARRYKRATTTMGKARTTERENETRETPTNQPHDQLCSQSGPTSASPIEDHPKQRDITAPPCQIACRSSSAPTIIPYTCLIRLRRLLPRYVRLPCRDAESRPHRPAHRGEPTQARPSPACRLPAAQPMHLAPRGGYSRAGSCPGRTTCTGLEGVRGGGGSLAPAPLCRRFRLVRENGLRCGEVRHPRSRGPALFFCVRTPRMFLRAGLSWA